jgi:hypothetical protein
MAKKSTPPLRRFARTHGGLQSKVARIKRAAARSDRTTGLTFFGSLIWPFVKFSVTQIQTLRRLHIGNGSSGDSQRRRNR